MYKIQIDDRTYKSYKVYDSLKLTETNLTLNNLVSNKLFNGDIFDYDKETKKLTIAHSSIRCLKTIPGVLVLTDNKEYGRKDNNRFYYKCVPDDKRLPPFLVPYKKPIGFNKKQPNKYVVFQFHAWDQKFPVGTLVNVLGCVTKLENFYEYQLYCKSLYASIQNFNKATVHKLKHKSSQIFIEDIINKYDPEDRTNWDVYTIDPVNSKDFDDAFSIIEVGRDQFLISIYIANTTLWLDIMDLWDSFSERIATIYLPDRKRPMLPTVLSDTICSLCENERRFAFTLDLYYDVNKGNIIKWNFKNTMIRVNRNFRYDTEEQETNKDYLLLKDVIREMNKTYSYVSNINSSHDVIAYLMILMNYKTAQFMKESEIGIYRSVEVNNEKKIPEDISDDIKMFLKMWNSFGSNYVKYDNIKGHDLLDFDAYVHITSPIRRLVDMLNLIEIQHKLCLVIKNEKINKFYEYWTSNDKFEYINTTMRSIRKVQNDCSLLHMCSTDSSILNRQWDGYVFDKITRNDGLYQYMIYIKSLKMVNRITSRHDLKNMSEHKFKIYVFIDENRLKQKIRLELIMPDSEENKAQ